MAVRRHFYPHPASVSDARHFVARMVPQLDRQELERDLELATSELATNAVRHAGTVFSVSVRDLDGVIRLEVSDQSPVLPPSRVDERNPGLRIVDAIAERWGTEPTEEGKTVWVELRIPAPQPEQHLAHS